jgi:hypothetical protein
MVYATFKFMCIYIYDVDQKPTYNWWALYIVAITGPRGQAWLVLLDVLHSCQKAVGVWPVDSGIGDVDVLRPYIGNFRIQQMEVLYHRSPNFVGIFPYNLI